LAYSYVVRIALDDASLLAPYVAWLRDPHLADVCAAGAEHGEISLLDERTVEARYRFASRGAYERYEREEAPRLRAQGLEVLAKLGVSPGKGVTFTRTSGEMSIPW
jgi:hypothetical protein